MPYDPVRALELLRLGTGNATTLFRPGQEQAIEHVVVGRGRLLVVERTGWGKSFVYFIATKLLREQGMGPVLLVSPLLSLMRNQIAAATRMGVQARTINSENVDEWNDVEVAIGRDEIDIILISPERLANERFQQSVLARQANRVSLLVVDEAHCISDWGHDFRPHYRRIERIIRLLPQNVRLLATTATANNRVLEDLGQVLGPNLTVIRGSLARNSLLLQTIHLPTQAERLAWLAENIPRVRGSGIVYTLTVRDSELVAEWLRSRGINVQAYSAASVDREGLEGALLNNQLVALVATTALGMGFDKPNLAFVFHYQMPSSVIAYYQQAGRAGRELAAAHGVLLSGDEDSEINDFFIESAFPTREEVELVMGALQDSQGGLSANDLTDRVNISKGRIDKALLMLSLESPAPVVKQGSLWQRTPAPLAGSFWQRAERLTGLRRREQQQMQQYLRLPHRHMEFLIQALDGDPAEVQIPRLYPLPTLVDEAVVRDAVAFLRRTSLPFEPRKKWPPGGLPNLGVQANTLIPNDRRARAGRALSVWGDAGWGRTVRDGKYVAGRFGDDLVEACVGLVRDWAPDPAPTWVTCIPSPRHPTIVLEFAERLAGTLGLPFHNVFEAIGNRPEQKTMANSSQQARNVDGSLQLSEPVPDGPVLLVDDMVKSKWTFTVAAWQLTGAGSGPVYPLALATVASGDQLE